MNDRILAEAEFNPRVRWYWLLTGTWILCLSVVGIPILPIFWLAGLTITSRYLARLRCQLTPHSLKVQKGLLVRVEKTIPLDKITDLGLVEGPIMRALDLQALSIETAGQSGGANGALVRLTGIVNTREFRDRVLAERDAVVSRSLAQTGTPALPPHSSDEVLREISATLRRIEEGLQSAPPSTPPQG